MAPFWTDQIFESPSQPWRVFPSKSDLASLAHIGIASTTMARRRIMGRFIFGVCGSILGESSAVESDLSKANNGRTH
jgi:hypothetical protein